MASVFDSDEGIEEVFRHFIAEKQLINDDSPSIDIFDIDYFKARMASLTQAFPEEFFLHALALKGMKIETLKSRRNKNIQIKVTSALLTYLVLKLLALLNL